MRAAISFSAPATAASAARPRISLRAAASAWAILSWAALARRSICWASAARLSAAKRAASAWASLMMAAASASAPAAFYL
jgi:hypothetical protein